jgi:hypothetical protein
LLEAGTRSWLENRPARSAAKPLAKLHLRVFFFSSFVFVLCPPFVPLVLYLIYSLHFIERPLVDLTVRLTSGGVKKNEKRKNKLDWLFCLFSSLL